MTTNPPKQTIKQKHTLTNSRTQTHTLAKNEQWVPAIVTVALKLAQLDCTLVHPISMSKLYWQKVGRMMLGRQHAEKLYGQGLFFTRKWFEQKAVGARLDKLLFHVIGTETANNGICTTRTQCADRFGAQELLFNRCHLYCREKQERQGQT